MWLRFTYYPHYKRMMDGGETVGAWPWFGCRESSFTPILVTDYLVILQRFDGQGGYLAIMVKT